jgi:ketosteroid isomerase-like protein
MSWENVELTKRAWDAWIRGDLDAVFERFDAAVEWDTTSYEGWPEDDVYHGHEGVRRFFEEWLASWESYEAGADEFIDVDGERVLVLCWQAGRGPGSRVPVHMDWAQICTWKDGLCVRMEAYSDRGAALEAVGLAERT